MRRTSLLTALAFCLASVGCGRIYGPVEEVKAFINEKQEAILEISKKLEADPTADGVDEARKAFEARIGRLQAKKRAIRARPQGALKADWMQQLVQSDVNDTQLFDLIQQKLSTDCYRIPNQSCSEANAKLRDLMSDFKREVKR
jgi:SUMO ligase MMS21 Smc5/6 complex component